MLARYSGALSKNVPPWGYAAFFAVALGWVFLVPNYWVFLGAAACLLAIAAMGLTVVVGWAGEVSLAQAALLGSSVYITGYMVRSDGWDMPFVLGAIVGIAVTTAIAGVAALSTAKLSGIYIMVLTLGVQVTIERTLFSVSKLTGGPEGVYMTRPRLLGISFDTDRNFYFLAFASMMAVIGVLTLFRKSKHGRALLLVRTNREAAAAVGISPWRYKILAFAISGALAGVAGALTAPLYRSPPTLLQYLAFQSLFLLAIPVTAGFESLIAVVLVAFSFQMIPHALESVHMSPFVVGGVGLLAGTYIGARGIGGAVLDLVRREAEDVALTGRTSTSTSSSSRIGANGHGRTGEVMIDLEASQTVGPVSGGER